MTPERFGILRKWRLRWKFEFPHKPDQIGMWDGPGPGRTAWNLNKGGLSAAVIEIKSEGITKPVVRCPGPDFRNFQWVAAGMIPPPWQIDKDRNIRKSGHYASGSAQAPKAIVGLSMWTRDEKVTVLVNGKISREPLNEHEKQMHFVGFGR